MKFINDIGKNPPNFSFEMCEEKLRLKEEHLKSKMAGSLTIWLVEEEKDKL